MVKGKLFCLIVFDDLVNYSKRTKDGCKIICSNISNVGIVHETAIITNKCKQGK